ncbi:MAG: glycosyltransferase family 39 protein [Anaerolineae bacterium]
MIDVPETVQQTLPNEPSPAPAEGTMPRRAAPWRAALDRVRRLDAGVTALALALIVGAGFYLRTVGIDWDAGQHLHPDERFLTDVSSSLHMPRNLLHYLDTDTSPLNPRNQGKAFFSYGTWPITIARVAADADGPLGLGMTDYSSIYIVGRYMSGLLDLLTVLLVFALGVVLYDRRVGLLAAALMAFTAFDIQQSHFFTVDTALTCFVTLTLLGLALAVRRGAWWPLVVAGVGLGMALGSKITVWLLVPIAMLAIAAAELRRAHRDVRLGAESTIRSRAIRLAAGKVLVLGLVSYVALRFAQPDMWAGPGWPNVVGNAARYAEVTSGPFLQSMHWSTLLTIPSFLQKYLLPDPRWLNNMGQIKGQVTGFGMDWPPNHQWWGRMGYVFPLRNMVLWGMGPLLGVAAWLSWLAAAVAIWRGRRKHLLPWLWVTIYFGYTGIQWAKTMRYNLPVYPSLALLAGWGLVAWFDWARTRSGADSTAPVGPRPDPDAALDPAAPPAPDGASDWDAAPEPVESLDDDAPSFVRRDAPPAPAGGWSTRARAAFERVVGGRAGERAALAATAVVVVGTMAWGWMFSRIYTRHHSRVAGSRWVYHNLPTAVGVHIAADPERAYSGPWLPAQAPGDLRSVGGYSGRSTAAGPDRCACCCRTSPGSSALNGRPLRRPARPVNAKARQPHGRRGAADRPRRRRAPRVRPGTPTCSARSASC